MSGTGDIRNERGFTLIEMLVTLGIAALIAGIGFPALQHSLDFWSQRAALATVRAALAEARSLALRTARPVSFRSTAQGDGFAVANGAVVSLPSPARLSAAASSFTFYPDGSASGGRVVVRSGARQSQLSIAPDTGLVSVGP